MLFDGSMTTPRPKPPAKARRSASAVQLKQVVITPPPPYMSRDSSLNTFSFPSFDGNTRPINSLLGSPIPKTAQLVGWDSRESSSLGKEDLDTLSGQSREELTGLLSRANELIKERESELEATFTVARTLHESNVSLKGKHEALLARIPSANSPLNSPVSSVSPLSPFLVGSALPRSMKESMGHFRRISVSPSDIALLSDQNSELMHQLEKLEDDSAKADQAGRRVLRKLEKEITELRAELDRTQARSAELEQKATMEDIEKRKREREAKLRALRGKPASEEDEQKEEGAKEVRDFAPAHPLSKSQKSPNLAAKHTHRAQGSPTFSPPIPSTPPPDVNLLTKPTLTISSHERSSSLSSIGSYDAPAPPPEYTLMSQLLVKIQELESANTAIQAQQVDTANKLQTVQKDAATISRVYECLAGDGDVDIEWEDGSGGEQDQIKGAGSTVRFKSLRRKLEGRISPTEGEEDDVFGGGKNSQDTARAVNFHTQKTRKSVVGLFDTPRDQQPQQIHHERSHSLGPASPALSSLSIMSSNHPLRSSLARELGNSWDEHSGSVAGLGQAYQRMSLSSLYDMDALSVPSSPPGSRTGSMLLAPLKPEPPIYLREDGEPRGAEPLTGLRTPVSMTDGPTVLMDQSGDNLRYKKMSQTVRARTRRWVDGRFKNTLLGPEQAVGGVQFPQQPDLQKRIVKGVDVMMDSFSGVPPSVLRSERQRSQSLHSFGHQKHTQQFHPSQLPMRSPPQLSDEGALSAGSQTQTRVLHQQQQKRRETERGFMRVVLELWLWLQFGIIIIVFLWAIARRGPKTVLDEAERRRSRVVSTTR